MANGEQTLYLRLLAKLHPDNRFELKMGYLTGNARHAKEDRESPVTADFYDDEGRLLMRYHVPTLHYCLDGKVSPTLAIRAKIPYPQRARSILIRNGDIELRRVEISRSSPSLALRSPLSGEVKGKKTIAWEAAHPDGRPLQFFIRYSHDGGRSWDRVSIGLTGHEYQLNFDALPGGKQCQVAVIATDGVNTVETRSDVFSCPIKPCRAAILEPEDQARVDQANFPVLFRGQGFYLEEGKPEMKRLVWESSKDGRLGEGPVLELNSLSSGEHHILLKAGDGSRMGQDMVRITVVSGEHAG